MLARPMPWLGVTLLAAAWSASAGPLVAPPAGLPLEQIAPAEEEVLFATPTRIDRVGRIIAPVMIDGKGPFRFIVDTGATRSTVSPRLVNLLGLDAAANLPLQVNGITGTAEVPSVLIHSLQAGALLIEDTRFPVLWAPLMAGADGFLGVAGLKGKRLLVDFQRNTVKISQGGTAFTPPGFDRISGRTMQDGLLVVSARVGGVRVDAIIDTGSERSIGNVALQEALAWRRHRGEMGAMTPVYGATTQVVPGEVQVAPTIDFGRVKISNVTLVYGDFHIFQVWGLQARPAIIIGMDVLGTVNALAIDFRRSELYIDSTFHLG